MVLVSESASMFFRFSVQIIARLRISGSVVSDEEVVPLVYLELFRGHHFQGVPRHSLMICDLASALQPKVIPWCLLPSSILLKMAPVKLSLVTLTQAP